MADQKLAGTAPQQPGHQAEHTLDGRVEIGQGRLACAFDLRVQA